MSSQGLDYLHFNKVVHGDLKPDNLLMSAKGKIKITDFGSSHMFQRGDTMLRTMGTPAFMAPEMCAGGGFHGRTCDIWALGICLYMFHYGTPAVCDLSTCTSRTARHALLALMITLRLSISVGHLSMVCQPTCLSFCVRSLVFHSACWTD